LRWRQVAEHRTVHEPDLGNPGAGRRPGSSRAGEPGPERTARRGLPPARCPPGRPPRPAPWRRREPSGTLLCAAAPGHAVDASALRLDHPVIYRLQPERLQSMVRAAWGATRESLEEEGGEGSRRSLTCRSRQLVASPRMSGSQGLRAAIVAAAIGCAFVVAGCGSGGTKPTTTNSASSNGPVSITVTSPTSGSVVGAESVTVRGTVTPATAKVEINGHAAAAGNGAFAGVASLHPGQNMLNVIASAPGLAPGTTTLALIRQTSGSAGTTEAHHAETATATTKQRPTPTVTATGSWPAATAAWTVVLASVGSRNEAEAQQERAHQAALLGRVHRRPEPRRSGEETAAGSHVRLRGLVRSLRQRRIRSTS
jgi:hypothetical protein